MIPLRRFSRTIRRGLVLVLVVSWATIGFVSGSFTATTGTAANTVGTAPAPEPVTGFVVVVTLNVLPPSCTATLAWASSAATVDGYEIERIRVLDGQVVAGPWTVGSSVTDFVDANVPLQILGQAYAWRVRAIEGTWRSAWATSSDFDLVLCALL